MQGHCWRSARRLEIPDNFVELVHELKILVEVSGMTNDVIFAARILE